jgi:outer membrane protein insertion porin family
LKRLVLILLVGLIWAGEARAVDKALLRWLRSDPPPKIDSIAIEGNDKISSPEIRSHLYSQTANFWKSLKGDRRIRVQRETRDRDTLEIKYLYLTRGFLNIQLDYSYQVIEPDSNAMVQIRIREGDQYRYGQDTIVGTYDREYYWKFKSLTTKLKPGEPVNPFEAKRIGDEIKTTLANRGYPYARVTQNIDTTRSPDHCEVTFDIESDSLVHFGEVTIEGTDYYPDYVARRELTIKEGAVYRREDILNSQRRLFESGYFQTFRLGRAEEITNRLRPDFTLSVRERKPLFATFQTGLGQSEKRDLVWDISTRVGKRNLFGSRQAELLADYSIETRSARRLLVHRYRTRLTEPWLFNTRTKLSLTGEYQPRLQDAVQEFDKESWSFSAALTKWYGIKLRTDVGFEFQNINISGIPRDQIPIIKEQEGISERRKLYAALRRDSRTDPFVPINGSVTELTGEYFGGFLKGDDNFFKIQASWSRYQIVWPGWIYASRIKGGWAEAFDVTPAVPLDEAMYLGGANTVRGFEENKLGPLNPDGSPEGARYTLVVNQEFRWRTIQFLNVLPIVGSIFERFPLWQSLFVDAGNGFRNRREIRLSNIAVSYGTGIQIVSPAGPIRIDHAWVLPHDDFSFNRRWHFTILYAF